MTEKQRQLGNLPMLDCPTTLRLGAKEKQTRPKK
jgi:hypothetical protein